MTKIKKIIAWVLVGIMAVVEPVHAAPGLLRQDNLGTWQVPPPIAASVAAADTTASAAPVILQTASSSPTKTVLLIFAVMILLPFMPAISVGQQQEDIHPGKPAAVNARQREAEKQRPRYVTPPQNQGANPVGATRRDIDNEQQYRPGFLKESWGNPEEPSSRQVTSPRVTSSPQSQSQGGSSNRGRAPITNPENSKETKKQGAKDAPAGPGMFDGLSKWWQGLWESENKDPKTDNRQETPINPTRGNTDIPGVGGGQDPTNPSGQNNGASKAADQEGSSELLKVVGIVALFIAVFAIVVRYIKNRGTKKAKNTTGEADLLLPLIPMMDVGIPGAHVEPGMALFAMAIIIGLFLLVGKVSFPGRNDLKQGIKNLSHRMSALFKPLMRLLVKAKKAILISVFFGVVFTAGFLPVHIAPGKASSVVTAQEPDPRKRKPTPTHQRTTSNQDGQWQRMRELGDGVDRIVEYNPISGETRVVQSARAAKPAPTPAPTVEYYQPTPVQQPVRDEWAEEQRQVTPTQTSQPEPPSVNGADIDSEASIPLYPPGAVSAGYRSSAYKQWAPGEREAYLWKKRRDTFLELSPLILVAICIIWRIKNPKRGGAGKPRRRSVILLPFLLPSLLAAGLLTQVQAESLPVNASPLVVASVPQVYVGPDEGDRRKRPPQPQPSPVQQRGVKVTEYGDGQQKARIYEPETGNIVDDNEAGAGQTQESFGENGVKKRPSSEPTWDENEKRLSTTDNRGRDQQRTFGIREFLNAGGAITFALLLLAVIRWLSLSTEKKSRAVFPMPVEAAVSLGNLEVTQEFLMVLAASALVLIMSNPALIAAPIKGLLVIWKKLTSIFRSLVARISAYGKQAPGMVMASNPQNFYMPLLMGPLLLFALVIALAPRLLDHAVLGACALKAFSFIRKKVFAVLANRRQRLNSQSRPASHLDGPAPILPTAQIPVSNTVNTIDGVYYFAA